jgi:hypothetical protein
MGRKNALECQRRLDWAKRVEPGYPGPCHGRVAFCWRCGVASAFPFFSQLSVVHSCSLVDRSSLIAVYSCTKTEINAFSSASLSFSPSLRSERGDAPAAFSQAVRDMGWVVDHGFREGNHGSPRTYV